MKIVVNKCYGGYLLSPKAVARMAELRGQKAYFFIGGFGTQPHRQVSMRRAEKEWLWSAFNTPTPQTPPDARAWASMSDEERKEANDACRAEMLDRRPDPRHDLLLVQVVEELGDEADGAHADLEVVEVPDGIKYEILEHDGFETICEVGHFW
jgi:hypothetical protein